MPSSVQTTAARTPHPPEQQTIDERRPFRGQRSAPIDAAPADAASGLTAASEFTVVTDRDALHDIAGLWESLEHVVATHGFTFADTWYSHHRDLYHPFVLTHQSEAGAAAHRSLVPLARSSGSRVTTLRVVGDGPLEHIGVVPATDSAAVRAGRDLARHLSNAPGWDRLVLHLLADENPGVSAFVAELDDSGFSITREPGPDVSSIALPATWDLYQNALPEPLRGQVSEALRWLETDDITVHRTCRAPEIAERWAMLERLCRPLSRRPGRRRPDDVRTRDGAFHRDLIERMILREEVSIWGVWHADSPVAAMLDLHTDRSTSTIRWGHDPDSGGCSAAVAVRALSIRHAIESGHSLYRFETGSGNDTSQWCAERIPTSVIDVARTPAARAARLVGGSSPR